jgi:hypothetical protein
MPTQPTISHEQEDQMYALWLRRVPHHAIAQAVGVNRNTVTATIKRMTASLAKGRRDDLELSRAEALAVYDAVQREAWLSKAKVLPNSNASVGYLGCIIEARKQQDRLLGLEQITITHRDVHLARIEAIMSAPVPLYLPGSDEGTSHE